MEYSVLDGVVAGLGWGLGWRISVAYLVGLPVIGYSLDLGKEHVNLMDEKLQKRLYESKLEGGELDRYPTLNGMGRDGMGSCHVLCAQCLDFVYVCMHVCIYVCMRVCVHLYAS